MEHWDPQMMLDLYIHNYLIGKDMHTSAEVFAREANFYPRAVAINPPEGFLSEWWSIFWSVYSARFAKHVEATEESSSKASENLPQNFHLIERSPDVNSMLQNTGNLLQSDLSTMMLRPESKLSISDFSVMEGQTMTNLIASRMREEERLRFPVRNLNSGSQLLDVDQLACMLESSNNSSHLQEKVYNNPQLSFTRDIGTIFRKSTVAEPTRHPPEAIQLQTEPADTDSKMLEQEQLWLPVRNLNFNSQILDVNGLASSFPSSSNCSQSPEKLYEKLLLSVTRDDKPDTCLRRSTAAPTCHPTKSIQFKKESIDTDIKMCESQRHELPVKNWNSNSQLLDYDQQALLLPCPSSHPQKNKKRQLSVTRDAEPNHAPKAIQPKGEPANTDAIIREQERSRLSVRGMNSDSQLVGVSELARLLSSSSNCSCPPKNANKKNQHSVNQVDRFASSLGRSTAAEPTRRATKAMQRKREAADIGSSTSSNSTSSDPSS